MSLKHGLLGLLSYEKMTGYELDKTFKKSLNFFWKAQTSQIYRELNHLEKNGYLTSDIVLQYSKPNKKVYQMTDKGMEELMLWLAKGEEDIVVKQSFLVKVFFSGERSLEENIAMLKDYRQKCLDFATALQSTKQDIPEYSHHLQDVNKALYWEMTSLFGEEYIRTCITWADTCIQRLQERKEQ